METTISEPVLRNAARLFLSGKLVEPGDILVDELSMPDGKTRVDLALVNGHIEAFEIKSDHDSLRRLPSQVEGYAPYFDRISLITTRRFLDKVASVIPPWWGIIAACPTKAGISLRWQRRARLNPHRDLGRQCQLLWKEDLVALARSHAPSLKGRSTLDKLALTKAVTSSGSRRRLCKDMRTLLKARIASKLELR